MGSAERSIIKRIFLILMLGFLASVGLSHKAWFVLTEYPVLTPLPFGLPPIVIQLVSGLLLLLVFIQPFVFASRIIPRSILFLLLVLFLFHQQLLQPWVWFYFTGLWLLSAYAKYHHQYKPLAPLLAGFQVFMALFYIISGVLKLNPNYEDFVLPFLLQPITNYLWQFKVEIIELFSFSSYLEIALGAALLVKSIGRYTKYGLILAHLITLFLISPFGINFNQTLWPWHLQMMALLFVSFPHKTKNLEVFPYLNLIRKKPINWVMGVLVFFTLLHYYKLGHPYLALDVFSGRVSIYPSKVLKHKVKSVPTHLDSFTFAKGDTVYLNNFDWSMAETSLPPCPSDFCKDEIEIKFQKLVAN